MPTYQYRCTECGRDLEVVQKFSDASLTECPTCAGQLRKVFNAVGVVFKGSGFYRNDSRAAVNGGSDGSDKKSEASGEKSGDQGGEKSGDKTREKSGEKNGSTGDSKPVTTESSKPAKVTAGAGGSSSTGSKAASS